MRPRLSTPAFALRLLAALPLAMGCAEAPPSVVLVTLDTTRADHLTPYGYPRPVTPHLEALARESVRFSRAWSTAPWTLPAHASLFTGLQPARHGAHADPRSHLTMAAAAEGRLPRAVAGGKLDDRHVTLAELLADRGYRTGAFVGGPWLERPFGLLQGFEHADDVVEDVTGRRADVLTDRAIAWLRGVEPEKPHREERIAARLEAQLDAEAGAAAPEELVLPEVDDETREMLRQLGYTE